MNYKKDKIIKLENRRGLKTSNRQEILISPPHTTPLAKKIHLGGIRQHVMVRIEKHILKTGEIKKEFLELNNKKDLIVMLEKRSGFKKRNKQKVVLPHSIPVFTK